MADVAQFDVSAGQAYIQKDLPPSPVYAITYEVFVPQATLDALIAASTNVNLPLNDLPGDVDSLYGTPDPDASHYAFSSYFGPTAGTVPTGVWFPIACDLSFSAVTSWDTTLTGDGTPFADGVQDYGSDSSAPFPFIVGPIFGGPSPGAIVYVRNFVAKDGGGSVLFADDFSTGSFAAGGWTVVGDSSVVVFGPPPVPPASIPYRSPRWRFVVGDLKTFEILSFLDRLATDRMVTFTLNQPAVAVGKVPSDNPEVNIPWPTVDDDPFLTEGSRVLWGFREEGPPSAPWVIRSSKIIQQLSDAAESDNAFSTYTAWDPWKYLFSRPVCNADGTLVGPDGLSFTATRVDVIAATLLRNTIVNNGIVGIDAGDGSTGAPPAYQDWGGTSFYTGTIDADTLIDIDFPQGTSVGAAWQMLTNMDVCDIVLSPIYDPVNRPGYLVEFNIASEWGATKDDQIFAWDMPSKSLVGINRLLDGTQRANEVKFFAGQGGSAPGGQTIPVQEDAASVTKFGEYWRQTFLPGQVVAAAVEALAAAQLALSKDGQITVTFSPAPERSPHPFTDYYLGDRVPVYASNRFRAPIPATDVPSSEQQHYQRIYGIPLTIADDATEQVTSMLTAIPSGS